MLTKDEKFILHELIKNNHPKREAIRYIIKHRAILLDLESFLSDYVTYKLGTKEEALEALQASIKNGDIEKTSNPSLFIMFIL